MEDPDITPPSQAVENMASIPNPFKASGNEM